MRLNNRINLLLEDLGKFSPDTLSSIVHLVRSHEEFGSILFMIRNSDRSAKSFLKICDGLISSGTAKDDVQLSGLLVLVTELGSDMSSENYKFLSRASTLSSKYHWSSSMAITYLINRGIFDEAIRISA